MDPKIYDSLFTFEICRHCSSICDTFGGVRESSEKWGFKNFGVIINIVPVIFFNFFAELSS
jgi:hypothetical protein